VSTYRLQDLLPPGSGWDISTNTSSSALGISENGTIVGTGIHNGQTHAYAMILQQVTAVALQSFDAIGRLDGIALRWSFSSSSDWTSVRIESAPSNTGPWQSVDSAIATEVSAMSALDTDVAPGETRFYRLQVTDRGGVSSAFGLVSATRGVASGVSLSAPSPNPASRGASMMFRVGSAQEVSLSVLDVRGRLVRNLYAGSPRPAITCRAGTARRTAVRRRAGRLLHPAPHDRRRSFPTPRPRAVARSSSQRIRRPPSGWPPIYSHPPP
jgi:hypothetical protein